MPPFTLKSTSKLRSALHFRYSIVYGSHFSATEATYEVSQNMMNLVEFTKNIYKN